MGRFERKLIAEETLAIVKQGWYRSESNKIVHMHNSENNSVLVLPSDGDEIVAKWGESFGEIGDNIPAYFVRNASVVDIISELFDLRVRLGVLNFASAKRPGGGFLKGSMAQEEVLCYASGLYSTQLLHGKYYESNLNCGTFMYTNHAIYSPRVCFFRDSEFNYLSSPVTCDVLTLPAVNMRRVRETGEDIVKAEEVMFNRMRLVLSLFAEMGVEIPILGAYGCGVFGNDPAQIADWWHQLFVDEDWGKVFKAVWFVVLDKSGGPNITAFDRQFG